ncbi:MAG TPA: TIM-barrel domain-containing protein [Verrucomicrobiae bacterium]|nr:TIM-barrel domain-containing protein [Verrucomicrobiae bacterium]
MKGKFLWCSLAAALVVAGCATSHLKSTPGATLSLKSKELSTKANGHGALKLDGIFYQTENGRVDLPSQLTATSGEATTEKNYSVQTRMPDGRDVKISVTPEGKDFILKLSAEPATGILNWGFAIGAQADEYFTGLMERTVDGPQQASWTSGIKPALNLRGQKVDMILKPTTSVYAPFYLSSRGYATFARTDWPGKYDFCVSDRQRVKIEFEGPSLEVKFYLSQNPATLVKAHALDAGPPFLPPKWLYTPWRWRDEHTQRTNYYDGTPVTGPFNSEAMEDIVMMKAYGIPCGVYWIDRPWGPGQPWGYDDFEIDEQRLPNFSRMIDWLGTMDTKLVLWIAPFFQGQMATNALERGWNLAGQVRPRNGNNYPMVDFSNPEAKAYWQSGVEKLLKLGVAGFKLDRAEENIPENGPFKIHDGRSIRENRNAYPSMYVKATYDITQKYRGQDFALMPRAAYTGTSKYAVFWGGDVGGPQEGLRASIIALQRSAVMGYPNWGADTCGYGKAPMEQEVCARWLAFSCFNPIMEVGPTRNVAFWNLPREPNYDATLIATWRLYARLHQRLIDYSYAHGKEASETGMPIARPLFLVDPQSPQAWDNWWTFLYGRDILVSPIWEKNQRDQEVYLPGGDQWRDAWNPKKTYAGGQTIKVKAELHQIPIFLRVGSNVELGDLNQEWNEAWKIAQAPPDLKPLDAEVKAWFDQRR